MATSKTALVALALIVLTPSAALAQYAPYDEGQVVGPPPGQVQGPLPAPPPVLPSVQAAQQGQWVYTADYGWVWVPASATVYPVGNAPYVYLYTPAYGWTWYVSPWGRGRFYVGDWTRQRRADAHVWHRGQWIAPPAVRVTPRGTYYGGGRSRGDVYHGGRSRGGHGGRR